MIVCGALYRLRKDEPAAVIVGHMLAVGETDYKKACRKLQKLAKKWPCHEEVKK